MATREVFVFRRLALGAVCALVLLPASVAQAWTWPVDGPVLRPFDFDRAHPYAAGQHRGVDLGAPAGTTVRAPASGTVAFAGTVPGGGKTISLETRWGYTATLLHLGSLGVRRGAHVAEGAPVGTVGPTGDVEGSDPFVYFGVRVTSDEQGYVDPIPFLPAPAADPPAAAPAPAPAPQPVAVAVTSAAPAPAATSAAAAAAAPAASPPQPTAAVDVAAAATVEPGALEIAGGATDAPNVATRAHAVAGRPHPAHHVADASANATPAARTSRRPATHRRGRAPTAARQRRHRTMPQERGRRLAPVNAVVATRRARGAPERGSLLLRPAWLAVLLAAVACLWLLRRRVRLDARPIMAVGEQLLHHDPDLLRQLDAAHRPRVHHDRGRHPHAPSQTARRGDVLPHRDRRARLQGVQGRRGTGARREDLRRPDRRVMERAA